MTFYNKIYLRRDIYNNLLKQDPSPENISILIHEQTHLKRSGGKVGFIRGLKYWFNSRIRYTEEVAANREQLKYLKKHGCNFDFEKRAKHLSGFRYLFCTSYNKALRDLRKIWEEI